MTLRGVKNTLDHGLRSPAVRFGWLAQALRRVCRVERIVKLEDRAPLLVVVPDHCERGRLERVRLAVEPLFPQPTDDVEILLLPHRALRTMTTSQRRASFAVERHTGTFTVCCALL